ncbi:MAG TPA: RNA polymerase sigma factor [Steroidobacteraceae bacterium]|jgi:RNA polymerase sigma-70 factor (ECF subfamily)|nr:RNA polymerase sigma factor [Steroidobacteraceae bacterium]
MTEEKELIRRMAEGDERAFEAFFDAYFARVYRFALPRLGGDAEAARDVVQATLVKVMRRVGDFRGGSTLFTWICQICRNEAVDYIRSNRRHRRHVVLMDDTPETRAAIESIVAPEEFDLVKSAGRDEAGRLVRAVLDRLPANYGNALEWKYMEDRSVEEIGERLGIGTIAAQSLLARARTAFREALEQVFGAAAADIAAGLGA